MTGHRHQSGSRSFAAGYRARGDLEFFDLPSRRRGGAVVARKGGLPATLMRYGNYAAALAASWPADRFWEDVIQRARRLPRSALCTAGARVNLETTRIEVRLCSGSGTLSARSRQMLLVHIRSYTTASPRNGAAARHILCRKVEARYPSPATFLQQLKRWALRDFGR